MPNTLTSIFVSNPATEPVEAPHPNTGVYVTGTQAVAGGPWTVVHTLITKTATPLTMVGRLKNFPTVTVSVVATGGPNAGNIFNNILATPTGTGATPVAATPSTALSVVVSSIANQTSYRLLAADTSTGPFTQIYQGTTATFPHTGLTASQTKWYRWGYVGGGFYDDSPLSAAFSGVTQVAAKVGPKLVIVFGNSVTWGQSTYSYPEPARTGALASRISFPEVMADGLASSNVKVLGYGYPGKRTDELNAYIATAITPNLDFVTYSTITVCVSELLNSVQQGRTFAQTQTDMNALIAAIRAVDSRIKIDFLSATPWLTLVNSGDAVLIQLNNYYKSVVGSTVDRFIDTRSVPVIGSFTTGYFFDDVHPNAYGYYAMAALGVKAYGAAAASTIVTMPEFVLPTVTGPSFTAQDDVANTATFGAGGFVATDLIYSVSNGTTLAILPAADLASNVITIPVGDVALAAGAVRVFKKYRYDFQPISPMAVTSAAFTQAAVAFDYTRFAFFLKSYAGGSTSALWKDLSGHGLDAPQANTGFVLTANLANGKAGYLSTAATNNSSFAVVLPPNTVTGNLTVYMAVRVDVVSDVFAMLLPSTQGTTYLGINSPTINAVYQGAAVGTLVSVAAGALALITWRLHAGATSLRINGLVKQTGFAYTPHADAGSTYLLNQSAGQQLVGAGFVSAVRIGDETDAQVTATEQLIAGELGITLG